MGVYDRQVDQAKRLIKKKGQLVVWVKHSAAPVNSQPWKSTNAPPSPATFPVFIVFLPPKQGDDFELRPGTEVPSGAPRGLMAQVTGFVPEINDHVLRGSDTLVIASFVTLNPNGEGVILYKLSFR